MMARLWRASLLLLRAYRAPTQMPRCAGLWQSIWVLSLNWCYSVSLSYDPPCVHKYTHTLHYVSSNFISSAHWTYIKYRSEVSFLHSTFEPAILSTPNFYPNKLTSCLNCDSTETCTVACPMLAYSLDHITGLCES